MQEKLNVLFIFTTGNLNSVYHKMWFNAFYQKEIDISLIIAHDNDAAAQEFFDTYNAFYRVHFTKPHQTIVKFPFRHIPSEFMRMLKFIRSVHPDIIHVQGCYNTFLVLPLLFIRKQFKLIFNIWGNDYNLLFRTSKNHQLLIRWLLKKSDLIWLMWYELTEKVKKDFPAYANKTKTILWGVNSGLLRRKSSERTLEALKHRFNLTDSSYKLIYVKGFKASNNQYELVRALDMIDKSLDFQVILHCAGANDTMYLNTVEKIIKNSDLANKVGVSQDYLTEEEMYGLFELADLSFAISSEDQLTITIFESIIANTNLILNDIEPYRILKKKTRINLDLIDITDTERFGKKIEAYIKKRTRPDWDRALEFIRNEYLFDKKTGTFIHVYQNLLKEN